VANLTFATLGRVILLMTAQSRATVSTAAITAPVQLLNSKQAAASLGLGVRTLQERVAAREIGSIKIGKSVRFHPDDIAAFIERNRLKAVGWKGGSK